MWRRQISSKSGDLDVLGKMFIGWWRKFFGVEIKLFPVDTAGLCTADKCQLKGFLFKKYSK